MRVDWLSPIPIFIFIVVLGVFLPVFSFLDYRDSFSLTWPFLFVNKAATAREALLIYAAVTVIFVLACRHGFRTTPVVELPIREVQPPGRFHIMVALYGAVTIALFGALVLAFGGIGEILAGSSDRTRAFAGFQGVFLALNISVAAVLMWSIEALKRRDNLADWVALAGFALVSLAIVAIQGQKSTIFVMIAALAVIYNRRGRRIALPFLTTGIVTTFVGLMAYHVYKQEYLVLGRVVSFSGGKQFWASFTDFLDTQLFGNFMQVQTMSVLIEGMPAPLPFQYGQTYIAGFLTLIPRAIFPDKPLPSTGTFTQAFWPDQWNNLGTTLPAGVFGEAYMNFGVTGTLVAAALFGWACGRIYGRHVAAPDDDVRLLDHAVAVASLLHFFRGEFSSVFILILSIVIPARLLVRRAGTAAATLAAQPS